MFSLLEVTREKTETASGCKPQELMSSKLVKILITAAYFHQLWRWLGQGQGSEWPNKLQAQRDKGAQATVHGPLSSLQPDLEKRVQMVPKSRLPRPWEEKEPPGGWQMVSSTGSAAAPHSLGKWQVPAGILSV